MEFLPTSCLRFRTPCIGLKRRGGVAVEGQSLRSSGKINQVVEGQAGRAVLVSTSQWYITRLWSVSLTCCSILVGEQAQVRGWFTTS